MSGDEWPRVCPHDELWSDPCQECEWDADDGRPLEHPDTDPSP